jgi:hypothetical protein
MSKTQSLTGPDEKPGLIGELPINAAYLSAEVAESFRDRAAEIRSLFNRPLCLVVFLPPAEEWLWDISGAWAVRAFMKGFDSNHPENSRCVSPAGGIRDMLRGYWVKRAEAVS